MGRNAEDNEGPGIGDPISITVDTYNKVASDFRRYTLMEGDREYQESTLKYTLEMLPTSPTILDVGCGDGRDTSFLGKKGADVVGLDLSKKMVDLARECYPDCKFVYGDIRYTPFSDNTFDCIWASASLIHFPKNKLKEVQKEIYRILKKEGILVLSFKKGKGEGYDDEPYGSPRYFSYYTLQELKEYLTMFDIISHIEYPDTLMNSEFVYCWARPCTYKNPLKGPR